MILIVVCFSFVQFADHDVMAELVGKIPVPRLPHFRHERLPQRHRDLHRDISWPQLGWSSELSSKSIYLRSLLPTVV